MLTLPDPETLTVLSLSLDIVVPSSLCVSSVTPFSLSTTSVSRITDLASYTEKNLSIDTYNDVSIKYFRLPGKWNCLTGACGVWLVLAGSNAGLEGVELLQLEVFELESAP